MMDLCEGAGAHEFTRLYVCVIYAFANIALALPLSRGTCTCAQRIALRAWWLRTGPYTLVTPLRLQPPVSWKRRAVLAAPGRHAH